MNIHEEIVKEATQAAREGAPSLVQHATRAADGAAALTIKLCMTREGGAYTLATSYAAAHTDKDSGNLPARLVDPRQGTLEGVQE
jgi:hypothetical protein